MDAEVYFWAKSDAGGKPHSLIGHLLDSGAVGELIWDEYLAPLMRRRLDAASSGRGRDLLTLLCGWHDLGKATPAFQVKAKTPQLQHLVEAIEAQGFALTPFHSHAQWPHARAGALIARRVLEAGGATGFTWLLPIIAGHHGTIGADPHFERRKAGSSLGTGLWTHQQDVLARAVAERLGIDLSGWAFTPGDRGLALSLSGFVIMADWIASSDEFPGIGLADLGVDEARRRARRAWDRLAIAAGWSPERLMRSPQTFPQRFGFTPRPLQQAVMEAAITPDPAPGLLVVEAPMGEGKTEAALAAAELLALRAGCDGVVVAMPTQGTTDAMYRRVDAWAQALDPALPVSLQHGKAALTEEWRTGLREVSIGQTFCDDFGMDDPYQVDTTSTAVAAAPVWILGRHRGLLAPLVVATVDQVLWAATRTRFVALRHAGLSGRVLVIDEVHSYDAYMSVFLRELLRWCGRMEVPTILMSATLPPAVRAQLVSAWRQGRGLPDEPLPTPTGYPTVLAVGSSTTELSCLPYRDDRTVRVRTLEAAPDDTDALAGAVADSVANGGCALVILNTVRRAQAVYVALRHAGTPSLLLHGRLTAAERARRTERALTLLGSHGDRPERLVIVATQIAEQSFDVDADIVFSDLAPVDLLLQRVGRLHRHSAHDSRRPASLRTPQLVISGLSWAPGGLPVWDPGFAPDPRVTAPDADLAVPPRTPYRPRALLAAAALVAGSSTWAIPSAVPALVADAYSESWTGPSGWRTLVDEAERQERSERDCRVAIARVFSLDGAGTPGPDLWNLHSRGTAASESDTRPVVRDGGDTLEVALVVRNGGGLSTLSGRRLGAHGERISDDRLAREVLGDTVRLRLTSEVAQLQPLPEWAGDRLLGWTPVLVLDETRTYQDGSWVVRYDDELGLVQ